jgi:purine-binding chemotaxis protein CheW
VTAPRSAADILARRARELARPLAPPAEAATLEAVVFRLGGERYAVESRHVIAVFRLGASTPLPGAAPPVVGLAAWRGELLALFDLRPGAGPLPSRVLVVGKGVPAFGLLADEVEGLARIPEASIGAIPEALNRRGGQVRGVTGDALLVLDAETMIHTSTPESDA